jgi:hypothetical protein
MRIPFTNRQLTLATSGTPAPASTPRIVQRKAYMTPASAATIFGGVAGVILYFFECWIDGHFSKNMLAAGVFVAAVREFGAVWMAGGQEAPPPTNPAPVMSAMKDSTLMSVAEIVRRHPSDSKEEVAEFIEGLARVPDAP